MKEREDHCDVVHLINDSGRKSGCRDKRILPFRSIRLTAFSRMIVLRSSGKMISLCYRILSLTDDILSLFFLTSIQMASLRTHTHIYIYFYLWMCVGISRDHEDVPCFIAVDGRSKERTRIRLDQFSIGTPMRITEEKKEQHGKRTQASEDKKKERVNAREHFIVLSLILR